MSDLVEIVFKGERKELFLNPLQFPFQVGDYAIVEAERGEDLGQVSQTGPLLACKGSPTELRRILRKPSAEDMRRYLENRQLEQQAFRVCLEKIRAHGLPMKLVDAEYQFDRSKITFYFTAEQRVDFRALVRDLASHFKTRIELRQIGVRDEARRFGGYGMCGRKLCCTTWLKEFEPITTQTAKDQMLPLNPQKLSGLCGRLLCCLMYERAFYREILAHFPKLKTRIRTPRGVGVIEKIDVFRRQAHVRHEDGEEEILREEDLRNCEIVTTK
jgi:cell fate regulator YaaT (PSP1 superfamily)